MTEASVPDILRRLWAAVRRKRPPKWRTNSSFSFVTPAHRSVLVKNFLAKKNVTKLEHPPYSPDLAAADFYCSLSTEITRKGRHFCDATDIIKNATEELKRLLEND